MAEIKPGYLILLPLAFISGIILFLISPHTQIIVVSPPARYPPFTINPTAVPSPTPQPLTLNQMNNFYGPCTYLPVLMYHHIQDLTLAKTGGYLSLTVSPAVFSSQMQYLADHHYHPVSPGQLLAFFNQKTPFPAQPVLLTFDDGYLDFYQNAFPLLQKYHYPALLFLPTGLADNPGYITWNQAQAMSATGLIDVANHTWSHHSMQSDALTDLKEISTADTQLSQHGLNNPKVFAYPFGTIGLFAEKDLQNLDYSLAFTTSPGTILCLKNRLYLPRVRIGNTSLNYYGL